VLKLLREAEHAPWLERELVSQRAALAAGIRAPEAIEIIEHEGRPGLVMERVAGLDGLTLLDRKPWRVWEVGSLVGRLHRSLREVAAPAGTVSLRDEVRHDIADSPCVPERARERLLAIAEALPDMDRLCHMDFHPGNVIISPTGPVVIDWASARRGDPVADHVKSMLLLQASSPPEMGLRERLVVGLGRGLAGAAYKHGYGRLARDETSRAALWRPVLVGQRLAEGIREERRTLLKMLARSLREAAEG
jgi:aminoglycoside phosphotransferase (APT) family kinase protein